MKRSSAMIVLGISVVIVAAAGYWMGFRSGFEMGEAASAVGNGWVAVEEIELIDANKLGGAKFYLEATVDDGLLSWNELSKARTARPALALLGRQLPDYAAPWLRDTEVRRMASYRKAHPSPQSFSSPKWDELAAKCQSQPDCLDVRPLRDRAATIATITNEYAQ